MNQQAIVEGNDVYFLREKDVLRRFPFSRTQLWALVKKGAFPAPLKLSERCSAWSSADLAIYVERVKSGALSNGGAQ